MSRLAYFCKGWENEVIIFISACNVRFQLAGVALEALFKLVCTLLPQPNTCVSSLYKLRKLCSSFFPDMRSSQYSYCKACFAPAGRCDVCEHCGNTTIGRFLVADIKSQLKEKFKGVVSTWTVDLLQIITFDHIKQIHL